MKFSMAARAVHEDDELQMQDMEQRIEAAEVGPHAKPTTQCVRMCTWHVCGQMGVLACVRCVRCACVRACVGVLVWVQGGRGEGGGGSPMTKVGATISPWYGVALVR